MELFGEDPPRRQESPHHEGPSQGEEADPEPHPNEEDATHRDD